MSTTINGTELPLATSVVTQEVKVRLGTEGQAAIAPKTIIQNFDIVATKYGNLPALHQKVNGSSTVRI